MNRAEGFFSTSSREPIMRLSRSVLGLACWFVVALAPTAGAAPPERLRATAAPSVHRSHDEADEGGPASIDVSLQALVRDQGGRIEAVLPAGRRLTLRLIRQDLFSADARCSVTGNEGTHRFVPASTLFIGTAEGVPQSRAMVVVTGASASGTLALGSQQFTLTAIRAGGLVGEPAVPPGIAGSSGACGAGQYATPASVLTTACDYQSICSGTPTLHLGVRLVCTLAIECDSSLYARCGNSTANVATYVQALLGAVSALYQDSLNVEFQITSLHVWAATDPFRATTVTTELQNFESWAASNLSTVHRRAALLLAGRSASDSWANGYWGWSEQNALCDSSKAYSVVGIQGTSPPPSATDEHIAAHELGHLFGAWHTFSCLWRSGCYLSQQSYPSNTLLSLNTTGTGNKVEGGCCTYTTTCDPNSCSDCDLNGATCTYTTTNDCNDLGFYSDIMAYGGGLAMHPAVKERMRELAELALPAKSVGIADLFATPDCTTITVTWTAPAGALAYDLRVSSHAITDSTFGGAAQLSTTTPGSPGSTESYAFTYGSCSGRKYYAVKWRDLNYSWSAISNGTFAATFCPHPPNQCDGLAAQPVAPDVPSLAVSSALPAHGPVQLLYGIPNYAHGMSLAVFDVAGRTVRTLRDGFTRSGRFIENWDLRDEVGTPVPRGVYFARLWVDGTILSRSIVIVR